MKTATQLVIILFWRYTITIFRLLFDVGRRRGRCQTFFSLLFPPPAQQTTSGIGQLAMKYLVVFFEFATNALNARNNNNNKRFVTGGCSEGLGAF